jgi:hypothetical protein
VAGIVFAFLVVAYKYFSFPEAHSGLWLSTAAGLVGAALSIAQGIKDRAVELDIEPLTNIIDGILRLLIGMICALILFIFLRSGLLPHLTVEAVDIAAHSADKVTWEVAIVIGFVAGFLERLVPDLIEKNVDGERKSDRHGADDANRAPAAAMQTSAHACGEV